jgi:hypothetical protein
LAAALGITSESSQSLSNTANEAMQSAVDMGFASMPGIGSFGLGTANAPGNAVGIGPAGIATAANDADFGFGPSAPTGIGQAAMSMGLGPNDNAPSLAAQMGINDLGMPAEAPSTAPTSVTSVSISPTDAAPPAQAAQAAPPAAPATMGFTGFSSSPPGVVGVAPNDSIAAQAQANAIATQGDPTAAQDAADMAQANEEAQALGLFGPNAVTTAQSVPAVGFTGFSQSPPGVVGVAPAVDTAQAEQEAIDAVMGVAPPGLSNTSVAPSFSVPAPTTPSQAELGVTDPTAQSLSDQAHASLPSFTTAPPVGFPSPESIVGPSAATAPATATASPSPTATAAPSSTPGSAVAGLAPGASLSDANFGGDLNFINPTNAVLVAKYPWLGFDYYGGG